MSARAGLIAKAAILSGPPERTKNLLGILTGLPMCVTTDVIRLHPFT